LTEVRQRVIVDLVFNMGTRAQTFVKCKAAIEANNWSRAVQELYSSKWASQVGLTRAHRLGQMLLTGNDYTS
jgi:lysozyme